MDSTVKKLIEEYFDFGGENRNPADFKKLKDKIAKAFIEHRADEESALKLMFIMQKLNYGLGLAEEYGEIFVVVDDTEESLEEFYEKHKTEGSDAGEEIGKLRPRKLKDKENLGKLVDEGDVPYPDRSDAYWNKKGKLKIIFEPKNKQIRTGAVIPSGYSFENMQFLEGYYNLRSIEFGNWLSQQDRMNYVAGLGIALFDLHHILNFRPHQLSLSGKLSVAFGARGRGSALAHFEPDSFTINITRYSRQDKKGSANKSANTLKYLTASGGVGSFAHEFGHALDYYAGKYIRSSKGGALSQGRSARVKPDKNLMKEDNAAGYMERLLHKIIWQNEKKHTAYYQRLLSAKKAKVLTAYYFRRNEIFARAFESYVHYKMNKKKYHNIFLAETKYSSIVYLTPSEMKFLEKDFDQLINAIKWKIKNK